MSEDSQKEQEQADLKMCQDAVSKLIDHFDSVQIFATRHDPSVMDGTVNVNTGLGNWFTRYGQVKLWVKREEKNCDDE